VSRFSQSRHKSYCGGEHNLNDAALPDNPGSNNAGSPIKTADYPDLHQALQKAYRLLSLRAHSVHEIEKKLRVKGFPAAVIKEALEKLHELKYLDDASFASQWARNLAVNKLWGNRKIIASLKEKGRAAHLIDKAIEEVRQEIPEAQAVNLLIKKKITGKKIDLQDIKEKKRIFQNLLARGFAAGLILIKLEKIPEEDFHGEDGQ
jgi:regulatory protein